MLNRPETLSELHQIMKSLQIESICSDVQNLFSNCDDVDKKVEDGDETYAAKSDESSDEDSVCGVSNGDVDDDGARWCCW